MNVLLINPPWKYKAIYPPFGLASLAAVLDRAKIKNDIIDCEIFTYSLDDVKRIIKEREPTIVGLTGTTQSIESTFKCAQAIKEVMPETIVILGGPHASAMPEDCISRKGIDIVVIGEGERTILELVQTLESGAPLEDVAGLCFKKKGEIVKTKPRVLIEDLDSVPFPAWQKLPLNKYTGNIGMLNTGIIATVMTSRGCPYQCTFCGTHIIWKGKFRLRSAENVLKELEELVNRYNVKAVMFKDDTLAVDKKRLIALCQGMIDKKLGLVWSCSSRVDNIDREILEIMKKAGCKLIEFGFESGSQKILERLKKGTNLEQARNAARWCRDIGINTNGFFMIGNQDETENDIKETVKFAKELKLNGAQWGIATPYPGTEIYNDVKDKIGKITNWDSFLHSNKFYPMEPIPAVLLTDVSPKILCNYVKGMRRHFLMRPRRIFLILMKIRSKRDFFRQLKAGIKLIFKR